MLKAQFIADTGEPGVPAYLGHEPAVAIEELQLIRVDTRCERLCNVNTVKCNSRAGVYMTH